MKKLLLFILILPLVLGVMNSVVLVSPDDDEVVSSDFDLSCVVLGNDVPLTSVNLYNDFNGDFVLDESVTSDLSYGVPVVFSLEGVDEGSFSWSCEGVDNESNTVSSSQRDLIVDYGVPVITIVNPIEGDNVTSLSLDVELDIEEGNIDNCFYNLNSGDNETFDCENFSLIVVEGSNTLEVYVYDIVDNFGMASVDFNVPEIDDEFPVVDYIDVDYDYEGEDNVTLTLDVTTNEVAVCRFDDDDDNYLGMELMNVTNDTVHTNSEVFTSDFNGTYYVLCEDLEGNIMNESISINFSVLFEEEMLHEWKEVHAGQSLVYTVDGLVVDKVLVKVKDDLNNVGVDVFEVDVVDEDYSGKVYKYFEIDWKNLKNSNIDNAKIVFSLPASWLGSNSLTRDEIKLFRYTSSWDKLSTSFVRKSDEDYIFEAETPGFSYFAIAVESDAVVEEEGNDVVEEVTANVVVSETLSSDDSDDSSWSFSPWLLVGLIMFVLVLCIGVYVYEHRKDFEKDHV